MLPILKALADIFAPVASAAAAIVAIVITVRADAKQIRIQERNIKLSLFDKRYAVYLGVEAFMVHIFRKGSLNLPSDEYSEFWRVQEHAGLLFGQGVVAHVKQIDDLVRLQMYEKVQKRDSLMETEQCGAELNQLRIDIGKQMQQLVQLYENRLAVFAPYLRLN